MLVSSIFSNNVGVNPSSDATILYLDVGVFSLIDCFVSSNSAKDFGAVMLLSGGAQINGTIFRGNSAKGPGGILYFSAGSLGSQIGVSSNTEVTITNSTFIKNHAYNGNGGAVAIDNYPGDINIANCTFSQNTAISGGAISSTGTNVFIDYCTFTENSAIQGGGGLYWTYASRYLVQMNHTIASVGNTAAYGPLKATNYIEIVSKVEDPSILDVSGSVIASSIIISFLDYYEQVVTNSSSLDSYQQTVSASIFDGDTGILKGQTVVIGASGTAVFSSLIVTALPGKNITLAFTVPDPSVEDTYTTLYFRNCIPGEIETSTEQGTAACSVCTVGTYSFDPTASTCEICPANAYCPGGDVIEVDAGYWRDSYYSATILRCFFRNVCLGGSNTTNQCAEGNTGPYCSVCEDGYAQDTEGGCYACDSSSIVGEVVAPIVFVIVIVILLVAFRYRKKIFKLVKAKIGEFNEGSHYRKFRIKIKILVAFIQILFELGPSLNIVFPDVYTHYLDYFTILDLDGLNLPAISCAVSTNYYTSLVVATISPMVLMLLILIALHLLVIRANRLNRLRPYYTAERAKMDSIQAFFLLSYFLLISVSTTIFQVYQCETFDDGGVYLVADYSIDCEADDRVFYLLYGTVMMFIYPIGIPLAYGIMLFRNRRKINPPYTLVVDKTEIGVVSDSVVQGKKIKVRKTYKELNYMKVLYDNYLPRRWYFELFDCARRLALGAIPVLIIRGSVLQIVIVLLMSLISVAVLMEKKPYIANADNDLAILAQWSITLVLVTALCIRVDVASESKQSSDIMGGILIVINILVIATAIVTTIISTNVTDEEDDQKLFEIEDPLAKLRGSEEEEEEEEKDGEGEEDGSDEDEEMKPSTGSDSIYDRDSSFVEEKKVKYKQSKGFKGYYDREDDETPSLSFVEPTEIEMSSMSKLRNNSIQSQSVSNVDTFHDSAHNPITNIMQSSNSKDETKFESEPDSVGKRNPKPNNSTKNPIFVRKDANDVIDSDDED